jgi:ketosteroid isomerase-like protein
MTTRMTAAVVAAAVAGAVAAIGIGSLRGIEPNADVRTAIEAANKKYFIDTAPKGDAALLAAVYTDDAVAYPANSEAVKGRAALQAMWKSVFDMGINAFELNLEEVDSAGDMAYETGNYVMKMKDGTLADRGKYVVIWKKVNGEWKLHRDIWTTNLPPAK